LSGGRTAADRRGLGRVCDCAAAGTGGALSGWTRARRLEPGADDAAGRRTVAGIEPVVVIQGTECMNELESLHFQSVSFTGLAPGAQLIILGAVHGNETCGTQAIRRVIAEIESGQLGIVAGTVTFVPVTNPLAYARHQRMGDRNLNRNLVPTDAPVEFEDRIANWL